ncbi:MAG: hypothetical protein KDB68_06270 [Planctomycetes bacterium]|nr:hypothetical protein [Planctomycetota bacterium]
MRNAVEYAIGDCLEFLDPYLQELCHESCLDDEGEPCWLWRGGQKAGRRPYVWLGCCDSEGIDGTGLHVLSVIASGPTSHAGYREEPAILPQRVYPFFVHDQRFHFQFALIAPGSAIRPHGGAQSWASRSISASYASKPFNLTLVDELTYWNVGITEFENRWGRLEISRLKNAWVDNCKDQFLRRIETGILRREHEEKPSAS